MKKLNRNGSGYLLVRVFTFAVLTLDGGATADLSFDGDGTTSFSASASEVAKTIVATADQLLEPVECFTLTLTIPADSTLLPNTAVGAVDTAQICVLDGTGRSNKWYVRRI